MMLEVAVETDGEWDSSTDWEAVAEAAAKAAIAESRFLALAESERPVEVSVRLTEDEDVRALNAQWRGKDSSTNVLSFPQIEPFAPVVGILGDITLARETLEREAADLGKSLEDHFTHLMVHGFLHILGYDHLDEAEALQMEGLETQILAGLGIDDPYAD